MKLKLQFIIATIIALAIYIPSVHGQANLTFSGGSGTPLVTTLQQTVTYTITDEDCVGTNNSPFFTFQGAGTTFTEGPIIGEATVTGTMTFSINGGSSQSLTTEGSSFTGGDTAANDLYLFGNLPGIAINSTVVLNAGTVTTSGNTTASAPAGGSYVTFIANQQGVRCSSNGVTMGTTAAPVSVSGRVLTSNGRGISNALVYLTDQEGNSYTARTNLFGRYHFDNVQVGQIATLTVSSKSYQFAPKVISLNEAVSQMDFVSEQ